MDIAGELGNLKPNGFNLGRTEKLILALCYKKGQESVALSKTLGKSMATIRDLLSRLSRMGLIHASYYKERSNVKCYIFKPGLGTRQRLPRDVIKFMEDWDEGVKKNSGGEHENAKINK